MLELTSMKKLVLASASERRRELLSWVAEGFGVVESGFDEASVSCEDPEELVMTLAMEKAKKVVNQLIGESVNQSAENTFVLGADTVVVLEDEVIGKPRDDDHARVILEKLRGREHVVMTGVAVIDVETEECNVEVEKTRVRFRNFSDKELGEYVETGIPMGKAGAYAYQEGADVFVEDIEGSLTSVIGLPIKRTVQMLEYMGLELGVDTERVVWGKLGRRD